MSCIHNIRSFVITCTLSIHTHILVTETCHCLHTKIALIVAHPTSVVMKSIHPITSPTSSAAVVVLWLHAINDWM